MNTLWANTIKKKETVPKQAQLFYESYRLALIQEDELRERMERMKKENEDNTAKRIRAENEAARLTKKIAKLYENIKVLREDSEIRKKSEVGNPSQIGTGPTKKRKLNEFLSESSNHRESMERSSEEKQLSMEPSKLLKRSDLKEN